VDLIETVPEYPSGEGRLMLRTEVV
jgi:hypothetical protein